MAIQTGKIMTLAFAAAMALPVVSSAAVADSDCCTSGSSCASMIKKMQDSCTEGNASLEDSCKAIQGLTQYEWLLQNPDLSSLSSDEKDIAGTYQVKVGKDFLMTNKWLRGDAPGISSNGKSDINLEKICYSTRDVEIRGYVKKIFFKIPFSLSFKSDVQSVQGKRGYFAEGGANGQTGRYFFSPVQSDRTPIDSL